MPTMEQFSQVWMPFYVISEQEKYAASRKEDDCSSSLTKSFSSLLAFKILGLAPKFSDLDLLHYNSSGEMD